ncbi:signal recognition particle protein 2 [Aphanomyces invadans]|uniref:Signal recognition particle protein 2 n=1 Tax=Aphanomyces invadans TaxID=157072 RepID=A0A024TM90_9STRA|nr:signal recognition particle protein 2 [Aphanomyces invadans]ETV94422.1 signal recognition particle protein 2 [Aphanomyces invadans]|eukprot:XP_008876737.1 signal recognition particle protein 2 [Aphanomyces invadans]
MTRASMTPIARYSDCGNGDPSRQGTPKRHASATERRHICVAEVFTKQKNAVDDDENKGDNRRRIIHNAVVDSLVSMLEPETPSYKMKKGQSNVVMFVGLQGSGKTTTIAKYAHYYQRKGRGRTWCAPICFAPVRWISSSKT